jgi:translation initiation factor RLI1
LWFSSFYRFFPGVVLGLVGTNGIGKSTALKVLAGKQKPNLGRFNDPPGINQKSRGVSTSGYSFGRRQTLYYKVKKS